MTDPSPDDRPPASPLLFVYGTLRIGFGNPVARRLHAAAAYLGPAAAPGGQLVDLGSYPGFIPAENGGFTVQGDLFRLPEDGALLSLLDDYEGCSNDPAKPGEYRREKRRVFPRDGGAVTAWVYLLNRPADGLPVVPGGDYLACHRSD